MTSPMGMSCCFSQHQLYSSDPTSVFRETFFNPTTGLDETWCTDWLTSYLQFQTLIYTTTAVVVGVNLFFRLLLGPVVKFEHNWCVVCSPWPHRARPCHGIMSVGTPCCCVGPRLARFCHAPRSSSSYSSATRRC